MITIFIDESGTLPDIKDNFIVICGVAVKSKKEAENIFSRILKSLRDKKINIKEIKFYHAGQNTKRQFLSGISAADFRIFVLIIDKKRRKIVDNPENYGILLKNLIIDIISWNKKESLSFLWKFRGKDSQFYDLIKENIVVEKIVNWPEIKRTEKEKKSPEPAQAPIPVSFNFIIANYGPVSRVG